MSQPAGIGALPPEFAQAVHDLTTFSWDPHLAVTEREPPTRIAPYAAAVDAEVTVADETVAIGRLILLGDPAGNDAWEGTLRCVTYARADVSPETIGDPFLAPVGWSWLTEALEMHGAAYTAASGTVTTTASTPFGGLQAATPTAELEIRASWSPLIDATRGLTDHVAAWQELLREVSGLPSLPGVIPLGLRLVEHR